MFHSHFNMTKGKQAFIDNYCCKDEIMTIDDIIQNIDNNPTIRNNLVFHYDFIYFYTTFVYNWVTDIDSIKMYDKCVNYIYVLFKYYREILREFYSKDQEKLQELYMNHLILNKYNLDIKQDIVNHVNIIHKFISQTSQRKCLKNIDKFIRNLKSETGLSKLQHLLKNTYTEVCFFEYQYVDTFSMFISMIFSIGNNRVIWDKSDVSFLQCAITYTTVSFNNMLLKYSKFEDKSIHHIHKNKEFLISFAFSLTELKNNMFVKENITTSRSKQLQNKLHEEFSINKIKSSPIKKTLLVISLNEYFKNKKLYNIPIIFTISNYIINELDKNNRKQYVNHNKNIMINRNSEYIYFQNIIHNTVCGCFVASPIYFSRKFKNIYYKDVIFTITTMYFTIRGLIYEEDLQKYVKL